METKFKQGREYLIKSYNNLLKIKILYITKTSYNIEWENGYKEWKLIKDFDSDYMLIEELELNIPFININNLKK